MDLTSKPIPARKLGILISSRPEQPSFRHGVRLAGTALRAGVDVYLYCIDDGVLGVNDPELQTLKSTGLKLYACAYGAQRRNLPINEAAMFAGLTIVNDLMASTDRFISFNG
ncbi:MAG: DsrE family protein [Verrucomicrobiales bacterium]|nr:DsrE family protein [Verrucomicrobiales bacterium]